eukprot:TRINITY_DN1906_c0_g1_i1.p1 TRINITY_DN1906_c0_g1~~TRINITY_DN1906_c0_g1_i1.p1  ORF type:complete len:498 (-),score=116.79 TRINITY_DN1906_c0_g1_i1:130-1551(-)
MAADEVDYHSASLKGSLHSQDNIWDAKYLEFSKWMRKVYFKEITPEKMQEINRNGFFKLSGSLILQFSLYWVLYYTIPEYFWFWALPLFLLNCFLVQSGEIVHTRTHWPKQMTGSDQMDTLVDSVAIIITGTSKESLRRRHIAAHYSDVGNFSRLFSDVWVPFSQFPSTFYIYPHKLLLLFLDVEYCRSENLSRQQILIEMIGFYSYLTLTVYELLFCNSCFIVMFHFGPDLVYHGAQAIGAMLAHSGIDKRNSFDSNGFFDWREAKGLFSVTLFVVDLFGNGGVSNHGIHHSHSQLPLTLINKNLREINAYALKNFKDIRYNRILAHNLYGDLHATLPEPKWYDYVIQFCFIFCLLFYSACLIMGVPLPPTITMENALIDYRFHFYINKADIWARWRRFADHLNIVERRKLIAKPNQYLDLVASWFPKCDQILKTYPTKVPISADFESKIMPRDVYEFNILRPMEELRKKKQ